MKLNQIKKQSYSGDIVSMKQWIEIKNSERWNTDVLNGNLMINENELKTLQGCPLKINGEILCSGNDLTSLEGGPSYVSKSYDCSFNSLNTLRGGPKFVGSYFNAFRNKLETLQGIHKIITECNGGMDFNFNAIKSNILGLLLIKNVQKVSGSHRAFEIINDHIQGDRDVLACQEEMISAGYKEYAKL